MVLGAGCGGDDSDSDGQQRATGETTTERRPTKAEFIERWDAICTENRKRVDAIREPGENASGEEQARALNELADAADDATTKLQRVERPPGDNSAIDQYLELGREQIGLVRRTAEAFDRGNTARADALIETGEASGGRLRGLAQGYGFKVCGSDRD